VIAEANKRKLRAIIETIGLLAAITWNVRTGHIVGGHRRLEVLDILDETKGNYTLTVNQVDLSDSEEREANIALNNPDAQGDFDLMKLEEMFAAKDMRLAATGWDPADVFRLFGESPTLAAIPGATDALAEKIRETQRKYEEVLNISGRRDTAEFYLVVIFRSTAEADAFIKEHELPDNRYQSADDLKRIIAGPQKA